MNSLCEFSEFTIRTNNLYGCGVLDNHDVSEDYQKHMQLHASWVPKDFGFHLGFIFHFTVNVDDLPSKMASFR